MAIAAIGNADTKMAPINAASREIDTTSFTVSVVFCSPRMITASSRTPNNGARITSTTNKAMGAGQPQSKRSCQYVNAKSIPAAPWAKLKMPVVVYVSTRPLAITA